MRVHILGICGTFMGGIAVIAKQLGYEVSGSDANIYPPMSDQLRAQGIQLIEGFNVAQLKPMPDMVIVGNAMKRGNPCVEYLLNHNLPLISGPEWLAQHVLRGRWVLGVAGTHGKTTTTSLLAWLLEYAGMEPNFLIGGVPENFGVSARYTGSDFFVIEADEYDTAFFDKRAKFIHYRPRTLVLNNLEFDHADIYNSLEDIKRQFRYLVRTIPEEGQIIASKNDINLADILAEECWTPVKYFAINARADWEAKIEGERISLFSVYLEDRLVGSGETPLLGLHNLHNTLAAIAAAHHVGVPVETSLQALADFKNVKRRLEQRGTVKDITIYDDFAHHPTAIECTLAALRTKVGNARILAVLECGSYTMRSGVHKERLADAIRVANRAYVLKPKQADWDLVGSLENASIPVETFDTVDQLVKAVGGEAMGGDQILVMSNSGFDGVHEKLMRVLSA